MEKLFQTLLENELLDEGTIKQIQEAFENEKSEAIQTAVTEAEEKVRLELSENFVEEKKQLIEALDAKAEEAIATELAELHEDIERFRDLEAEQAKKLVEAKEILEEKYKTELAELVDAVDSFLDARINEEFAEIKTDLEEQRKSDFGRKIYEAVIEEAEAKFLNKDGLNAELTEKSNELENTVKELEESKKELETLKRDQKMTEVLESLVGRPREIMEAILTNIPTDKLDEAYDKFIPNVLNESTETTEKEDDVLSESVEETSETEEVVNENETVVTGDTEETVTEEANVVSETVDPSIERLKKVAGVQ